MKAAIKNLIIRVAIYLRVSLEEQAESGHGLQAQEDATRAYAARQGWEVIGVFAIPASVAASGWMDAQGCLTRLLLSTRATCCLSRSGTGSDV